MIHPRIPLAAAVFLLFGLAGARAVEPAVEVQKKEEKTPRAVFPPEIETKFAEFLKKVRQAKKEVWVFGIKTEVQTIAKTTGLDAQKVKALEEAGQKVAESCIDGWIDKVDEMLRRYQDIDQLPQMFDQIEGMIEIYPRQDNYVRPLDHPGWTEAVHGILSIDQNAAWAKAYSERQEAFKKEIAEYLKPQMEGIREQKKMEIAAKISELKLVVTIPKEGVEKLEALSKTMADESVEAWRKQTENTLFAMAADQRRQIIKRGRFYFGSRTDESANQQTSWTEAIGRIISPEDFKRWQDSIENRKQRRVRIMGSMMLALLDEKFAFTALQRQKLQPVAERLIQKQPMLLQELESENYSNFPPQIFFTAAASASAEEIRAILDEFQYKRWQDVSSTQRVLGQRIKPVEKAKQPERAAEPEDFENAISDFFCAKAAIEKKRLVSGMVLQAEDAARITGLGADAMGRLQTAARGAAEKALANWKTNIDQSVRSQLQDVPAQNIRQRLAAIPDYLFERQMDDGTGKKPAWDGTIQAELNEGQRAAWKKEIDERNVYHDKAISAVILAEFDRKTKLSPKQWEKLEPLVAAMTKDYSPDIERMFSSSNDTPWYLQSITMFIPFTAIPEKDLKAILGKEQWDHWTQSNDFSNNSSYFENVKQNHERRVKEPKQ